MHSVNKVKDKYVTEKYIFTKNNKLHNFNKKWSLRHRFDMCKPLDQSSFCLLVRIVVSILLAL